MVNYRTPELAIQSLFSLARGLDRCALQVLLIDNASDDGSVDTLGTAIQANGWDNWVSVLPQEVNAGFAAGNNVGIRYALQSTVPPDYVTLLNPDTIVREGAIEALVDFMDSQPSVGIAGSRIEDAAGHVQSSAHNLPSPLGELEGSARLGVLTRLLRPYTVSYAPRDAQHECEWVSGASLIARRQLLEQIGLLDEGYFLYFEEVDLCVRARKAGWKVWYVPESTVVHMEGASTGIRKPGARRPSYWYASRRRYFVKHFGVLGLFAADLLWALGRGSLVIRRMLNLAARRDEDPAHLAFDLLWGDVRAFLTESASRLSRRNAASSPVP